MGQYRVHVNLAPSGGRSLAHGEIVEIADEDLGPYQRFIDKRWLTSHVPPGSVAPAVPDVEVEDASIVGDESDAEVPVADAETPAE